MEFILPLLCVGFPTILALAPGPIMERVTRKPSVPVEWAKLLDLVPEVMVCVAFVSGVFIWQSPIL